MLEVLVGISLCFIAFEFLDEWHQRRQSKRRLAAIRQHSSALRRPWDTLRGRWADTPADNPSKSMQAPRDPGP
ncbi:MAG: hypothetical protein JWL86_3540 [Rhizobium sp.]|nr:hypothetical protein [Rhizobium sp.]